LVREIRELNQLRLDRNLPFRQLAEECGIPYRTLFRILTTPNAKVYDRTLHRIRLYLDQQRQEASA
jgi:predicted transcriptional regulator